ncbi:MAG: hemolysin activation/secretion protein [Gammaproteobacteria bacterium]|jgi:hemolysin activation/secretion protein
MCYIRFILYVVTNFKLGESNLVGYDVKRRTVFAAAALSLCAISAPVLAQVVPTPGAVQEQIRRQPTMPVTPGDAGFARPAPATATSGIAAGGRQIPINKFDITGNSVISAQELQSVVSPFEGRALSLFEIYEVADVLTQYYRDSGYSVASVTVPEQKISSGTVKLEVIEGRIGALSVDGNKAYRHGFLRRHVTGAAVGDVISEQRLERDLLLLNDLPGLQANAVVEPGSVFGESNLTVKTKEKRIDAAMRFNNYGRTSIGEWKIEGDFALNAPLGVGDQLVFNIAHADGGKLDYFNFGYSAPILFSGTRAAAYFSRNDYNVDSDELPPGLESLDISGDGDNFGFNISHPFIRSRKENLYIGIGYDRVITRQRIGGLGLKDKADISLMNLNLLYSRVHLDNSFSTVSANFATNFDSNQRDPVTLAPGNNAQTAKMRVDMTHLRTIVGAWSLFGKLTMVGSVDPIVDTQKYRIGGRDSVRGYASSELAGDGGYAATIEIQRQLMFADKWPTRAFIFGDTGTVTRKNAATIGLDSSESISGAGVGLESLVGQHYRVNLELAKQIGSQESTDGRDGVRVWFGLTANF